MVQGGTVSGFKPTLQGRMVRTDHFKYCVYDYGDQRESLVDMRTDPMETRNVARQPDYRHELLRHRELLQGFASQHDDTLVDQLLAGDAASRPFPAESDR